jgi:transcriptional regulator with XRE-family HTH domain
MTQGHGRPATLSDLVAEEVRALMARRKVSGRELADLLGVSPSWISYRLNGKQPIDLNDLERIANALEVPILTLIPTPTQHDSPLIRLSKHRPKPTSPRPKPKPFAHSVAL